jgi:hypothetical protein
MSTGPTFVLEEAFPESYADALEEVLVADRDVRKATARKSIALMRAHRDLISPVQFGNRMLANRSFRAQIALLLTSPKRRQRT